MDLISKRQELVDEFNTNAKKLQEIQMQLKELDSLNLQILGKVKLLNEQINEDKSGILKINPEIIETEVTGTE